MRSDYLSKPGAPVTSWLTPIRFGAVLGLLLLATFPKVMLGLESFVYRDYGVLAYPFIHYDHESFWRGELPLWNPFSNCGAPFLAQWGTMPLYPFSIFYLLLPLPWSLSVFCLGHLFLGGMGMYYLARNWTNNSFAATVGGVAFVFNGITLSCLMWPNYIAALGWMPWVLWSAERARKEGGRKIVAAAFIGVFQMLVGAPEIAGFTWLLTLAFCIWGWVGEKPAPRLRMGRLLGVVLLVTGLMAVQLIPFFDLLEHSQRDRAFATSKWALPGWGWANLLAPLFHCFQCYQGPFVQQGQAFFSSCYLGVGILALAIIGAWRARQGRVWILAAFTLFGLIAALGENGHLYVWMKQALPVLGVGRYPVKFMLITAFTVPMLGAFAMAAAPRRAPASQAVCPIGVGAVLALASGSILWFAFRYPFPLDQWTATWHNAVWRLVFLGMIIGGVVILSRLTRPASIIMAQAGLLILLALDVNTHTPNFNPAIAAAEFEPGLWQRSRQMPPPALGQSRVMISPRAERVLLSSTETNLAQDFLGKRLALWSNLNLLDGIPKVNGSSTLQLREQKQVELLLYDETNQNVGGLMDFLAVSHSTAPNYALDWATRTNCCPLVTCGQEPIFAAPNDTLQGLVIAGFDPRKTVFLPVESAANVKVRAKTEAKILQSKFSAHRVEIEVEAKTPSLVVIAQTFYHPWRASINGRPARLLRANHAFQAVEAPAGRSSILLTYRDGGLFLGAAISGVTLMICLLWWRSSKPTPQRAPSLECANWGPQSCTWGGWSADKTGSTPVPPKEVRLPK